MAAADTASAAPAGARTGAGSGGVQLGGGVHAGSDGLLQFVLGELVIGGGAGLFFARRLFGLTDCQPFAGAAEVESLAILQLQADHAGLAGLHLFATQQAITLDQQALHAFRGKGDYLADNTFHNSNDTAHGGLSFV